MTTKPYRLALMFAEVDDTARKTLAESLSACARALHP
jgi:hypothetical protein